MPADHADVSVRLMLRVKDGDEDAFSLLYDEHHRRVLNFFFGLSADAHLAQDLRQETFLRIWKLRGRYRATGSFVAYILTFARYIWLENCRKNSKRYNLGALSSANAALEQLPAGPAARPDNALARSELEGHIFGALSKLPEDQRMAFVLRVVEGLSTEETASVMQCPVNTVRSRKVLAIRKLRVQMRRMGVYQAERPAPFREGDSKT